MRFIMFVGKFRLRKIEISHDEKLCVCRKIASHTEQSVTGGAGTVLDQTVKHTNKSLHNTLLKLIFPLNESTLKGNLGATNSMYHWYHGGPNI